MRQCGTIRINCYVDKNYELQDKLKQAGITLPRREADIWDWSKTITPVQEKLIIALAIQYEMYVLDPIIGNENSGK